MLHVRSFLLVPLEAPLDLLRHWLEERIEPRLASLQHQTTTMERTIGDISVRLGTLATRLEAATAKLEKAQRATTDEQLRAIGDLGGAQRRAVGEMWSSVGDRLNEIELKLRPILAFDEAAYAVRLGDGYILCPRDQPILLSMLADATTGGLEPGTRKVLQALLEPGMKAADVGANIGLLTLAMGRAVGPTGQLWSFEPEDAYRSLVAKSLHLNGVAWVDLRPEAVGAENGLRTFHISSIPGHSSLFDLPADEKPRDVTVQVVRLDDVVPAGVVLDVCKIDVEGAELEVLAGMGRILTESPDIALVVEYGPSHLDRTEVSPENWFAAFEAEGFEPFAIDEAAGRCYAVAADDLTDVLSVNIVFVRRGSPTLRRLPR